MTKRLIVLLALSALSLALPSVSAKAFTVQVFSKTFSFGGACTGTPQTFVQPFGHNGTVFGGDIVIPRDPSSGIDYASAGVSGGNIILWAGPKQTHVTSFPGFSGFLANGTTNNIGYGFPLTTTDQVIFRLKCGSGRWQAFLTLWFQ